MACKAWDLPCGGRNRVYNVFMRRLFVFIFATFVWLTFSLPLFAQHGGGHASSGGHGGGFGGHSFSGHSSFSAPPSSSPAYSVHAPGGMGRGAAYAARPAVPARSRAYAPALHSSASSANRAISVNRFDRANRLDGGRFRVRNHGFTGPWRYGYPGWYGYYGYYDPLFYNPYWWWDSSSSYDDDRAQDIAQANQMNEQNLEDQRARGDYNDADDQDAYARSQPYEPRHSELTAPSAPTTLVFRDQHTEEIQNYAIVGHTLFNFSAARTQKIPLSDLDIPATTKVNGDRGVNFKVPGDDQ
jgi:hypothetical protein